MATPLAEAGEAAPLVLVLYTTRYREGGDRFAQVARTLAGERRRTGAEVVCSAVESKADFRAELAAVERRGMEVAELHFIGHSGIYGIMFGTRDWPEQFSPHEWQSMHIPFAANGQAYFHACRTARWFAPFFADTFQKKAHGYHWYTTFSLKRERYLPLPPRWPSTSPLYVFGCPGRRSHGTLGAVRKWSGFTKPEVIKAFEPQSSPVDHGYDPIADLYADAFQDIAVRKDEWRFLTRALDQLSAKPTVLDVGCGNGALLHRLSPRIARGVGLDASKKMVEISRSRCQSEPKLSFESISGPAYPLPDNSVDVVVSLLSFRYLDWDPTLTEIHRVLRPGGRLLVIDMVERPPAMRDGPRIAWDKIRDLYHRRAYPAFTTRVGRMVNDPRWQHMLRYNPIRSDHEFRWYLHSRFPAGTFTTLNRARRAHVLAFDSGPITAPTRSPFAPSTFWGENP